MAIVWGPVVGGNQQRVGIELWYDLISGGATARVWARYWITNGSSVSDTQTLNRTTSLIGSTTFTNNGGTFAVQTLSVDVPLSYAGTTSRTFGANVTGHYGGAVPSVQTSITLPRRPYELPNPPPSASVSRVNDSQINVTWELDYSPPDGPRPWNGVFIDRWDNVTGAYVRVATLTTPSLTSWSDRSVRSNRDYWYRVQAHNPAGRSGFTYAGNAPTSPAAPSNVRATKNGDDITVAWDIEAYPGAVYEINHAGDGVWDILTIATTAADATSWTHVNADPAKTHAYRVRALYAGLRSPWSGSSNTIQLLAAPDAPTGLSPSSTVVDANETQILRWRHNAVDGTGQTAYELRRRLVGASSWTNTGKVSSSSSQRTLTAGTYANGTAFEWQVRTYGQHATASPWSTVAVVTTSGRPTALITNPSGGTHGESSLTAEWSYYDPEGSLQSQYRVTLYNAAGGILETRTSYGYQTSRAFSRTLENNTTYQVGIAVRDGDGLWSEETRETFTVTYAPPATPTVAASWHKESGAVLVTVTNPAYTTGQVDTTHSLVYRAINDGEWVLIADNVPPGGTVTDYTPIVGGVNHYRATAVSALPSTAESVPVAVPVDGQKDANGWVYLNAGPGFGQVVRVRANAKLSTSAGRAKVLRQFAGRTSPVEFAGQTRTRTGSLSVRLAPNPDGGSTPEEVEALADMPAPICLRTPLGQRWFVSLGDVSTSYSGIVAEAGWDFTVVDYVE